MDDEVLWASWQRLEGQPCADRYPDEIELRPGGVYLSRTTDGRFVDWQSGDFELSAPHEIRMQTANDRMVAYAVSMADDRLTFVDGEGCRVIYVRVPRGQG